jgi:hypothetical protein
MVDFEGFSEISILYAEKYDIVSAMEEAFQNERKHLFQDLQNVVADSEWFAAETMSLYSKGARFEVRLKKPSASGNLARIQLYLSASRLGRRELYSDIWLVTKVSDMSRFRQRFRQTTGQKLIDTVDVADYKTSGRYLIRRRAISFEVDTIFDTMVEEIERLRQFFPYVEQVYLDLVQDEEDAA